MEPVTIVAVSTVCAGAVSAALRVWAWQRVARSRGREVARRQYLRCLPAGSRVVDLGDHCLVIDIGDGEGGPDGRR